MTRREDDDDRVLALRRAVLSLSVYCTEFDWKQPYNRNRDTRKGGGTAFVVDGLPTQPRGFLALTAYHVVQHAASIRATLFEEDADAPAAPLEATLVAYSLELDTAVIRVHSSRPEWLVPLRTGGSDDLMTNTQIKVAGFPLRDGFQVTTGFVSGRLPDRVQVDASVNPGNSGGPLIRERDGRVVGVVVSGYQPDKVQNVNFCTPYEDVRRVLLPALDGAAAEPRSVPASAFNFNLVATSPSFLRAHTRGECASGAMVTRVDEGSSAHRGGLRVDDVVCSIDGHGIGYRATVRVPWWRVDALGYTTLLPRLPVGVSVDVAFYSASRKSMQTARVELQPDLSRFRLLDAQSETVVYARLGGVVVQPLSANLLQSTELLQRRFGYVLKRPQLRERSLLVVTHIDANSPFTTMNQLALYDAVVGVNDAELDGGDLEGYTRAFEAALKTGTVVLRLYTGAVASASAADVRAWQAKQHEGSHKPR